MNSPATSSSLSREPLCGSGTHNCDATDTPVRFLISTAHVHFRSCAEIFFDLNLWNPPAATCCVPGSISRLLQACWYSIRLWLFFFTISSLPKWLVVMINLVSDHHHQFCRQEYYQRCLWAMQRSQSINDGWLVHCTVPRLAKWAISDSWWRRLWKVSCVPLSLSLSPNLDSHSHYQSLRRLSPPGYCC